MEGLDKLLAATEGMVNAEQEANVDRNKEERFCLNCSTRLTDIYCPHCGQKDIPKRQTLGELVFNFISSFSGYESKFFVTCRHLLFKPGFLATEYNEGKRERYFHPARMYAFISFIFFLLFFSLPDDDDEGGKVNFKRPSEIELEEFRDGLKEAGLDSLYRDVPDSVLLDSIKTGKFFKEFGKSEKNRGFTLS